MLHRSSAASNAPIAAASSAATTAASAAMRGSPARTPSHRWCATAPCGAFPEAASASPIRQCRWARRGPLISSRRVWRTNACVNASVPGALGTSRSRPGLKASSNATAATARRHAGRHGDGGQVELAADNCRDREKVVGCFGQPRQPSPDDITNALGKTEVGQRSVGGPHPVALEDRAGLDEVGHDLLGEERVPVGLVVQCGDELGWCVMTGAIVEQRTDRLLLETAQQPPARRGGRVGGRRAARSADGGGRHRCRGRCPARASARLVRCSRSTGAAPASPDRPSADRRAPTAAGWCRRSARAASRPRRTAAPDLTLHPSSASPRHRARARRRPRCTARDPAPTAPKQRSLRRRRSGRSRRARAPTPRTRSPPRRHTTRATPARRHRRPRPPPLAASRVLPIPGSPATSTSRRSRAVTALFHAVRS